ncbi:M48 family metallopeptidase [Cellulosilyticum sp. I15G10I2]|uniref:M48 family metallopeptidase n=1 Tax=Cellulosilyticum sp. I15G10I2 TaxID=1892843 RepID=UPI00085BD3E7|nr:SprT family zinc-dependent metalloprotease [Cellulosilyticum sp. I15G10I2]
MYQIIRQKRKTVAIDIDNDLNIVIKVPHYLKTSEINKLIQKHQSWIEKRVQEKTQHKKQHDWRVTNQILYLGEYREIYKIKEPWLRGRVVVDGNQLIIKLKEPESREETERLIEQFFKEQADSILTNLTDYYADLIHVSYNKITIRNQKTRWGSCSSKGNISYNVKILCALEEMIAYIVLHEVMHLKHFNHGKAFWQEIAEIMPDYKDKMNYFKQFGQNFII